MNDDRDAAMRLAAADHLRRIATADTVSSDQLASGFTFEGERVPLINPQRGIRLGEWISLNVSTCRSIPLIRRDRLPIAKFTTHDLRRTVASK